MAIFPLENCTKNSWNGVGCLSSHDEGVKMKMKSGGGGGIVSFPTGASRRRRCNKPPAANHLLLPPLVFIQELGTFLVD